MDAVPLRCADPPLSSAHTGGVRGTGLIRPPKGMFDKTNGTYNNLMHLADWLPVRVHHRLFRPLLHVEIIIFMRLLLLSHLDNL